MLFYAAREQLYTNIIKDTIKKNRKAFVQDRCWMSTYAYQVKGLERISTSDFWVIHNLIMKNAPKPDLAIYLDIPPEVGFRRIQSGRDGNESDRLEGYDLAFYERARAGYLELASRPEHNISVIDANQDIESVTEDIRALVEQLIKG
jgi:dTMP kinase